MKTFRLSQHPQLENALVRMKNGPAKDDFAIVLDQFKKFSQLADADGLFGLGEVGAMSRGAAGCWRDVVGMLEEAGTKDPPPKQPGDVL